MSTGTVIIENALQQIGAHSVASPASASSLEDGRLVLNSMLESWLSKNIFIGATPLNTVADQVNEPNDTFNGIIYNLAVMLAPRLDNGRDIVSPTLRGLAVSSMADITNLYRKLEVPKKVMSSTMIYGAGNAHRGASKTFVGKETTLDK